MTDLRLDSATGDLDLTTYGAALVRGADGVRQQLSLRLSIGVGEWMLDQTAFVPWRQKILVRNPDLQAAAALFRRLILTCPEVEDLLKFRLNFDNATSIFRLDFTATTSEGAQRFVAEDTGIESLAGVLLLQPAGSIV